MPNTEKKSLRGDELRTQVLETALSLFSVHGYFNTSIHDIRKEAGVSIGAIYHHFKNKEALAFSLYESLLQQMENVILSSISDKQGCHLKCKGIIESLFELTLSQPQSMQFILLAQHREYLPDEAPICSSAPFQLMKNVIQDGIKNGEVRQIDSWVAASAMFGGALRMMGLELDKVLDKPISEYLDEVVECGWYAIKQ